MNILFVCNDNVARSQEAEAFFNSSKQDTAATATSGGINVILDKPIDPMVIEVMSEIGYDLTTAQRKLATEAMTRAADKIISFKPEDELPEHIKNHTDVVYWPVADPRHQPIEFHRQVRDEVKERVDTLIEELDA